MRDAYTHLLDRGVTIQRALDHICQRSVYFTDPDGNGLEIYYEMPNALALFPNGRGDEDERLPLTAPGEPLPAWLTEDWPNAAAMAKVERLPAEPGIACGGGIERHLHLIPAPGWGRVWVGVMRQRQCRGPRQKERGRPVRSGPDRLSEPVFGSGVPAEGLRLAL